MKKLTALILAACLLLALCACGSGENSPVAGSDAPSGATSSAAPSGAAAARPGISEDVDLKLRVGQMGTGIKAAMVVLAHEMGYYDEEGLEVTLEPINNLNDGLTAVMVGTLDVLPFGVIPTCTFVSQGADLTIIGGTIAEGSECVVLPEKAESYTEGDLSFFAGKKIACVRPETGHMVMQALIREAGVDMDTVEFIELDGFQSVVEAVLKGEADVGFVNSGFGQNARAQGLEVLFPVGEYAPDAVCCRQTALRENVEANREAYVRFEVANLRAMMLMLTDEDTTVEKLSAFSGQDSDYVWNCIYDGVMKISMDPCAKRVQEFYDIMVANGDIPADSGYDMGDHVDATIYHDALERCIERYPDFQPFRQMLSDYEENDL